MGAVPPYLRVAAELRARIASGELRAGERVPSTRGITEEWGVALATATKALAVLRQEGLVRAVPGVGTVVVPAPPRRGRHREPAPALTRNRVVRVAIAVADAGGTGALSMRAVAAELGVGTMVLYRHVPGKDELVTLMADTVFGEARVPAYAPDGWRARLEVSARVQWALYRRHPWLAKSVSTTGLLLSPNALGLLEWTVAPAVERGLGAAESLRTAVTLAAFVRGIAVDLEEAVDERFLGIGLGLDAVLEFGLARLLDGLAPRMPERRPPREGRR
ncbi:GntR family transcriptional regulator [Streptomyces sp. UNOB3_S3]|uniref:GntR family transcriptional regulator n=1 Tax=Streptomyces sp. UNOB3_S3 TaxID=2871682 RepID=UPI001E4D78B9|nr:GntR family transcriptional regulator [Streptomyces sp. UNOB3_S3]MCC3773914.1 GntR family transcriptional regulator [Streptomyces sp. UNOB3_S3]